MAQEIIDYGKPTTCTANIPTRFCNSYKHTHTVSTAIWPRGQTEAQREGAEQPQTGARNQTIFWRPRLSISRSKLSSQAKRRQSARKGTLSFLLVLASIGSAGRPISAARAGSILREGLRTDIVHAHDRRQRSRLNWGNKLFASGSSDSVRTPSGAPGQPTGTGYPGPGRGIADESDKLETILGSWQRHGRAANNFGHS